MAIRLTTTISKIGSIPNPDNSAILRDFYEYLKANGTSENYQNHNLKAMIVFANFLGPDTKHFWRFFIVYSFLMRRCFSPYTKGFHTSKVPQ